MKHPKGHNSMPPETNQQEQPEAVEKREEEFLPGKVSVTGKEITFLVLIIIFVSLLVVLILARDKTTIITVGDRAPEFQLPALGGSPVSLSDYRGKVVMVHFWATWCPPCVEELPVLESLYQTLKSEGLEILAISIDKGEGSIVSTFMKRYGLTFPVLLDPEASVSSSYGTFKLPETYIVDRQGVVAYKAIGSREWTVPVNVNIVRNIIDKR